MSEISWWRTSLGEEEIQHIIDSISHEHISQGAVTAQFERQFAKAINVPYAVATTSGSMALFLALLGLGIGRDDEVILPNRTFIATANAVLLTGAKVILVDTQKDIPIIDASQIKAKITSRTKAILPVHLNGRGANMSRINQIAEEYGLLVIEDACQGIFSKTAEGYMGTLSDAGCFSLGMGKLISTGQGGVVVTKNRELYERLVLMRTQGVSDTFDTNYNQFGFNFRYTDIQASIGQEQLLRVPQRLQHVKTIYRKYDQGIKDLPFINMIPVDVENGEVAAYIEVECNERSRLRDFLHSKGINTRPFLPNLNLSPYLNNSGQFPNSMMFHERGLFLPAGPAQPLENIEYVIKVLHEYKM